MGGRGASPGGGRAPSAAHQPADPPAGVVEAAQRALSAVEDDLLYARVDLVERPGGVVLMELELIEPTLFFGTSDGSSERFARAVRLAVGA